MEQSRVRMGTTTALYDGQITAFTGRDLVAVLRSPRQRVRLGIAAADLQPTGRYAAPFADDRGVGTEHGVRRLAGARTPLHGGRPCSSRCARRRAAEARGTSLGRADGDDHGATRPAGSVTATACTRPRSLVSSLHCRPSARASCPATCSSRIATTTACCCSRRTSASSGTRTGCTQPDDAFFTPGFRAVITNEEFNDTLAEISLRERTSGLELRSRGNRRAARPATSTRPTTRTGWPSGDHDRRRHQQLPDRRQLRHDGSRSSACSAEAACTTRRAGSQARTATRRSPTAASS